MAIRKQSRRPKGAAHRKPRTILRLVESLEQRLVLSSSLVPFPLASGGTVWMLAPSSSASGGTTQPVQPTPSDIGPILAHPPVASPLESNPAQDLPGLAGYTPQQIQTAYGLSTGSAYNNNISFGGIKGDGAGQTIGIFEQGYNPAFVPTSGYGNYSTSALAMFDKTFGLPDPPSLNFFDHTGKPLSATNNSSNNDDFNTEEGAGTEIALDIEWAHAMAPEASIDVLSSFLQNSFDLPRGMATLAGLPGVSVVSVSYWATQDDALGQQYDSTILQPAIAAHPNVSFFVASGDYCWPSYPSLSPEVVSVGGTSLSLTSSGQWSNEIGWSYRFFGYPGGSGGGYSQAFPIPPYQQTDGFAGNNGMRTSPDVSADADPATGVAIYDPFDFGADFPWGQIGGTSLSAPLWAGMASIADQGRVVSGGQPLGATAMLTDLYDLASIAPGDFHDITQGTNLLYGFNAGPGYDLVAGLGTPKANLLLPDLAAFGLASKVTIATEPPPSVAAGASFGIIADATDSIGVIDPIYNGTATLSLATGPSGASFTPVSVSVVDGMAVFTNLSLSKTGIGYTFQVAMTGLKSITTSPVSVFSPKSAVGYFYPIPLAGSLEAAVAAADSNSDSSNIITLSASSIPYPATTGQLMVENSSSLKSKSFTIIGQGESSSVITAGSANRVFEIVGTSSGLSVVIQELAITGGRATDGGIVGGNPALGGGLLIDGGNVALSNVAVNDNAASGAAGARGAAGRAATAGNPTGGPGGNGGAGGNAQGGGIYLFAGSLTLSNDQIQGNLAKGGTGGVGGVGGPAGARGMGGAGGPGGNGGDGGSAQGGSIYLFGGNLTLSNDQIQGNLAQGGAGGAGGTGGTSGARGNQGSTSLHLHPPAYILNGGDGGNGGAGGNAQGGGIYLSAGNLTLSNDQIQGNLAQDGAGGSGGFPGAGGTWAAGGHGGSAAGGGLFNKKATATLTNCTVSGNSASNNGGGLANYGSMVTLTNCTISGNSAGNNGGGLANYGSATLGNTIVAGNTASNSGPDARGTFTSLGHNLIGETDGSSGWVGSDLKGTIASPLNADLAPLADYGGPTQTIALLPASPAIGAGSIALIPAGVKTDQRGYDRTVGGKVDIGAYETQSVSLVVNTTVDGGSPVGTIDLRAAIDLANIQSGAATITFDNNVFKTPQTITLTSGQLELNNTSGTQTITGPKAGVTLSANGLSGVFQVDAGVTASISGMTISGGSAYNGGGLDNYGTTTLTNCTISGNSAGHNGGGLDNYGTATLTNCTLSGNSASEGGGIENNGTATLTNTIVAGQSSGGDIGGGPVSGTHNLIGTGGSGGLTNGVNGNLVGVANPGLAPLGNYGGTAQTMALLPGSPAIGAGASGPGIPTTDERGLGRPGGAVDIGAFESQGFTIKAVAGSTPQKAAIGAAFANPLAVIVTAKNPIEPVNGGVVTLAAQPAANGATAIFSSSSAVISSGQAAVTAGPNNADGSYTVTASASGASPASFALTNTGAVFVKLIVNTASGSLFPGAGLLSLPEAVSFANLDRSGNANITFSSTVFNTAKTITLMGTQLELSNTTERETITGPTAGVMVNGNNASRVFQVDAGVTASISGMTISGGSASSGGGLLNYGSTTLTNCTISGNSASVGAGVSSQGGSSLTVDNSTFEANRAVKGGGAIYNLGHLDLLDSGFTGNSAGSTGGAISNSSGGTGSIAGCEVSGNHAGYTGGGGISVSAGQLTIVNTSIDDNSSASGSGGLRIGGGFRLVSFVTLTNCTISGNSATIQGGGLANYGGMLTLTNCTISSNSCGIFGGGLANFGFVSLGNTIIAGNTAYLFFADARLGPLAKPYTEISLGHNLIGQDDGLFTGWLSSDLTGTEASPLNADLAPLADYGGPTQTIALLPGSPAIGAGSIALIPAGVTTDQRGYARTVGGKVDIGAYETQAGPLVVNTTVDGGSPVATIDLRAAVDLANIQSGAATITFDPTVFATPQTITLTSGQLELNNTSGTQTITGPAGGVTVSGGGNSRVFKIDGGVTASISGMTISGGSAYNGGGLDNYGTTTLTNCTISGNSAGHNGGGLDNYGTATLTNCTLSGNSAGEGGGLDNNGTAKLTNTIVAGQSSGGDIGGGPVSGTNNLIGTGGSGGLTNGVNGNLVGVANPGLAPLGNYGGTAQMMALLPGSPARSAGASGPGIPTTDERGLGRPGGAVDIGAFESQGFTLTVVPGSTPQTARIGTPFANPLAVTVTANNPVEPVNGGVVTLAAQPAANGATAIFSSSSAVISSGQAAVTAGPNNADGSYTVTASASGASPASFALTNTGAVFVKLIVNTASGSLFAGAGLLSLPEAVSFANLDRSGNANITFSSTVFNTAKTITLMGTQLELSNTTERETITGPTAGVTVNGNNASRVFQVDAGVTASISGMTISGGSASSGGGLLNYGSTTLTNCTISGNSAGNDGGGLENYGTLTLAGCTVSGNSATIGAGVSNQGGSSLTVDNSNFEANHASRYGGAIYNLGHLDLLDSGYTGNSAGSTGGAISNSSGGTGSIAGCDFSGNQAGSTGGGGISVYSGALTIVNTSIDDNSSASNGGGLLVLSSATLTNCTISGNSASNNGGGLANYGTATLTNCTVSGDSAGNYGGGLANYGTATLGDTIVAGNAASNSGPDAFGTFASEGHNLIGKADGSSGWLSSDLTGTIAAPLNPLLAPLVNYGGPTQTMALLPGSRAIDAGSNSLIPSGVTTDQRGLPRIVNGTVDIGAFESNGFILVLDPSAGGALSLSGNASINFSGVVYVDSSSSSALSASGNAEVKAAAIDVDGKVQKSGNASLSPAPVTGAAVIADPLASLPLPSTTGMTSYGSFSLSGNSSKTIQPGIYSSISVSGNAKLTMASGIYIIQGGGFSVSGNASVTVTGSGVMIFNAGSKYSNTGTPSDGGTYGSITLGGNGTCSLSPMTSGPYAGIVFFQPNDNKQTLTVTGNASGISGTIYAPGAGLSESGSGAINASLIVDTITIGGNAVAGVQTAGSGALGAVGGPATTSGGPTAPTSSIGALSVLDQTAPTSSIGALSVLDQTAPTTVPVQLKIKLTDALGNNVSAPYQPVVSMTAAGSAGTLVPQPAPGSSQPVGLFAFDPTSWASRFNLKTKGPRLGS